MDPLLSCASPRTSGKGILNHMRPPGCVRSLQDTLISLFNLIWLLSTGLAFSE